MFGRCWNAGCVCHDLCARRQAREICKTGDGQESKASAKRAIGQVTSVDVKTGKLAVKAGEQDLSLNVQASPAKESLGSIKIGDNVSVTYRDQGGMLVADAITKSGPNTGDSAASRTDKAD